MPIAVLLAIRLDKAAELRNLACQKGSWPLESGKRTALPRHLAQLGQAHRVVDSDVVAKLGLVHVRLSYLRAGVESVDVGHQIEDHAEHIEILTTADEFGMWHARTRHRAKCRDLPLHRLVTGRARVASGPGTPHRAPPPPHSDHDVLRAARQRPDVGDL